ncbi:MAG: ABC transporter permease [Cyclobacteriaceae bacterium]
MHIWLFDSVDYNLQTLNAAYFISKRITSRKVNSFSGVIHGIAIGSVGVGLAIMIISFQILGGFKEKIYNKMISFGGHLQVTKFSLSSSYEEDPISNETRLAYDYKQFGFIDHIQQFAHKAGLLKANDEVLGVLIKGVDKNYDFSRFKENMIEGQFIQHNDTAESREIIISKRIADKLELKLGDEPVMYFVQQPVRARRLTITGIYETGMEDFDDRLIIGDLRMVQRLNNWPDSLIGGFEVFIKNFDQIEEAHNQLYNIVDYDHFVEKISDKYAEIFDWLSLLPRNVFIFLTLTFFVACFNIISIMLILIMERTQMIGVLKAIGASNRVIRKVFRYNGMQLILKGLLIGNGIGIGFGALQHYFRIIKLDADNYYMDYVPIIWQWEIIVMLNIVTFSIVSLVLFIPTYIISRINPIKSIRFD